MASLLDSASSAAQLKAMWPIPQVTVGGAPGARARYSAGAAAARRGLAHPAPFAAAGLPGGFAKLSAFLLGTAALPGRGMAAQAAPCAALPAALPPGGPAAGLWLARWTRA